MITPNRHWYQRDRRYHLKNCRTLRRIGRADLLRLEQEALAVLRVFYARGKEGR